MKQMVFVSIDHHLEGWTWFFHEPRVLSDASFAVSVKLELDTPVRYFANRDD